VHPVAHDPCGSEPPSRRLVKARSAATRGVKSSATHVSVLKSCLRGGGIVATALLQALGTKQKETSEWRAAMMVLIGTPEQ
jgi:hypothetical protein